MKKIILSLLAIGLFMNVRADEGMWIPMLIGKNIDSMQAMGLTLSAEDIYSVNHASLKDAIVHFGGGCTAEMISPKGLLITNHHCGYGSIAALSTVENNYLEDGFWAKNYREELPAKGLTVRFLVRMEDVTDQLKEATSRGSDRRKERRFNRTKDKIEEKAAEDGKYITEVVPFFEGNQYIVMVYQEFTDVRLVATPPKALGKFGGNTDNWMWPRHTADFSIFRVYADSNNNPAPYSITNVPYHPKKYLPISLNGYEGNSFTMVMGYPGRTNRYETSYGVAMAINEVNPSIVKIRDLRLSIMRKAMKADPAVDLKLASSYASIANYWKYYIGQTEQLKRLNVIDKKRKQEQEFTKWAHENNRYFDGLMPEFAKLYATYHPYAKHYIYFREAFGGSLLARLAAQTHQLHQLLSEKHPDKKKIAKEVNQLKNARERIMERFVPDVEQEILAKTAALFYHDIPKGQQPDVYQNFIFRQFTGDSLEATFDRFAAYTFANTLLLDDQAFTQFCLNPTLKAMDADPAITYALSFVRNYYEYYQPKRIDFLAQKKALSKKYIAGLMQKNKDKLFYPDANSTMRVTYGKVAGYYPEDAVYYNYYTTLKGLLAKYIPGDDEFGLPDDFLQLAKEKDFGRYANEKGELPTCFITNNDITGGNSGSPVINAKGELLGLAFDGNWEAMSGDIAFDKQYKRCISVDIRFVLWLIDKYGNADNLIREMELVE